MMKTVTTDQKRRVVLPNVEPGEVFEVRESAPGHLELTKLVPAPRESLAPAEVRRRMTESGLRPRMNWESLRSVTRED